MVRCASFYKITGPLCEAVLCSDREKYITNRQHLESQLTENTLVKSVSYVSSTEPTVWVKKEYDRSSNSSMRTRKCTN